MASTGLTAGKVSGGGSRSSFCRCPESVPSAPTPTTSRCSRITSVPAARVSVELSCGVHVTHPLRGRADVAGEARRSCRATFLFLPLGAQRHRDLSKPNKKKSLNRLWQFLTLAASCVHQKPAPIARIATYLRRFAAVSAAKSPGKAAFFSAEAHRQHRSAPRASGLQPCGRTGSPERITVKSEWMVEKKEKQHGNFRSSVSK